MFQAHLWQRVGFVITLMDSRPASPFPAGALPMKPAPNAPSCPECEHGPQTEPILGRRDFIRVLGTSAAVAAVGGLTPLQKARAARAEKQAQAEALVFELFGTMSPDQKTKLVLPWDHKN